ncbi:hypothetical protein HDU91_003802 [Kappamyces sp. JEL0680]|nr:hypothetical protein HDU91_003802 [Kappamyces sp. JEL0680]
MNYLSLAAELISIRDYLTLYVFERRDLLLVLQGIDRCLASYAFDLALVDINVVENKYAAALVMTLLKQIRSICSLRWSWSSSTRLYLQQFATASDPIYELQILSKQVIGDEIQLNYKQIPKTMVDEAGLPSSLRDCLLVSASKSPQALLPPYHEELAKEDTARISTPPNSPVSNVATERSTRNPQPGSSGNQRFSGRIRSILLDFYSHTTYPTRTEKTQLATETKLSYRQIDLWFINHRRRSN